MASVTLGWKPGSPPRGVSPKRLRPPRFDALSTTAHELQKSLNDGKLKSTDLVEEYVWRIEEHNTYLHAISEYAPGAFERAEEMDRKRAAGEILGPLHGIPIVLKNTIATDPSFEMGTTAGAAALIESEPSENAAVVEKLLAAGAVILGKSTVSELSFHKGVGLPCGWSAVDGQAQSPYVRGGVLKDDTFGGHSLPGGSSSGLSIALAAGLAAGGVGSDTEASITAPAIRTSLYSIRPTHGIISPKGVVPVSRSFDTPGTMGKNVRDVADMLSILVDPEKAAVSNDGYKTALNGDWKEIRIGTLDPLIWQYPDFLVKPVPEATEQIIKATREAYDRLKSLSGAYHESIELRNAGDFMLGDAHTVYAVQDAEFEEDFNGYLASLKKSKVKTLRELVDWNTENAAQALPGDNSNQDTLINNVNSPVPAEKSAEYRKHYREVGSDIDNMFRKYDINIIIAPGDCFFTQFSSATGYPLAALPLGYLDYNGRPIGLQAMAAANNEELLLKFMHLYETSFPPRQPPLAFQDVPGLANKNGSSL